VPGSRPTPDASRAYRRAKPRRSWPLPASFADGEPARGRGTPQQPVAPDMEATLRSETRAYKRHAKRAELILSDSILHLPCPCPRSRSPTSSWTWTWIGRARTRGPRQRQCFSRQRRSRWARSQTTRHTGRWGVELDGCTLVYAMKICVPVYHVWFSRVQGYSRGRGR
jgi:hypothetical protein